MTNKEEVIKTLDMTGGIQYLVVVERKKNGDYVTDYAHTTLERAIKEHEFRLKHDLPVKNCTIKEDRVIKE
tara:strand:+ start:330 stop:542 length:213 start_codon:yes stop_codon:yes gene_type:complete